MKTPWFWWFGAQPIVAWWLCHRLAHSRLIGLCLACVVWLSPMSVSAIESPLLTLEAGSHSAPIRGLDVSADGQLAITVSDDRSARIWDMASGQLRQVIRPAAALGRVGRLYAVAVHPTQDLVAFGGTTGTQQGEHRILFFKLSTGQFLNAIDARGASITRLRWTPDGQVLLAVYRGDAAFRAFDHDGRLLYEEMYDQASYGLDVAANGTIATTAYDGMLAFYRYQNGQIVQVRRQQTKTAAPRSVAFSPDGKSLAVGYRGVAGDQGAPTIHDAATGALKIELPRPALAAGNLATITWSPAGNSLIAAGSGYERIGVHLAYRYDLRLAQVSAQSRLASNTITALVPLSNGRLAYTSFDGSWGIADSDLRATPVTAPIADFRGPNNLRINADATRVGVFTERGAEPVWFDLNKRLLYRSEHPIDLEKPRTSAGFFNSAEWENTYQPEVNGQRIQLASDEVSRSIAFYASGKPAILGSSKQLRGIDAAGQVKWTTQMPAEVWSVNLSADDSIAVTALADGTIRWWRADDGAPLLSLFLLTDGRWILWSPSGFFDASAGADRLAGWLVNRADQPLADFYSLNRFRDQFNRPAVLDGVLSLRNESEAMSVLAGPPTIAIDLGSIQSQQPSVPAPAVTAPVLSAADKVKLKELFLPPVLMSDGPPEPSGQGEVPQWTIPFSVRSNSNSAAEVEVRIDGRPAPNAEVQLREQTGAVTRAVAMIERVLPGSTVQLIAKDENGVSEPLGVRIANVVTALATPVPSVPEPVEPDTSAAAAGDVSQVVPVPSPELPPVSAGQRLVVLAIGISEYQKAEYQLGLAAKDASDFAATLNKQAGRLFSSVESRVLTNAQATGTNIKAGFSWLERTVGPDDLGILFMAGHGLNSQQGDYYFLPWEANHLQLATTGVRESVIRQSLSRLRGRALMFVDTCYAGGALGTFKSASRELASFANDMASSENGVVVFASSTGRQLSEENDEWGNGAFTRAAIDGLTGKADFRNTGRVTYKSLDFYISERVSALTEGRQTPVTISPIGVPDFPLAQIL